jgi:2-oxoglutarate ferredoxin oxidoreductase subunit delta
VEFCPKQIFIMGALGEPVEFCPKQIFIMGALGEPQVNDPTKCTECRLCEIHCPEFCITVNAI